MPLVHFSGKSSTVLVYKNGHVWPEKRANRARLSTRGIQRHFAAFLQDFGLNLLLFRRFTAVPSESLSEEGLFRKIGVLFPAELRETTMYIHTIFRKRIPKNRRSFSGETAWNGDVYAHMYEYVLYVILYEEQKNVSYSYMIWSSMKNKKNKQKNTWAVWSKVFFVETFYFTSCVWRALYDLLCRVRIPYRGEQNQNLWNPVYSTRGRMHTPPLPDRGIDMIFGKKYIASLSLVWCFMYRRKIIIGTKYAS